MTQNPEIGHLYHDRNISNAFTILDAREKMRTREINARESKSLDKYSGVIDRAKLVCRRQNEWEQMNIRKHLDNIKLKTPSLAKSLRLESERVRSQADNRRNEQCQERHLSKSRDSHTTAASRKKLKVSSWSVYSHMSDRNLNGAIVSNDKESRHGASPYRSSKYKESCASAKAENLAKRVDQVTKTLHSLYTKSFERKWKEKDLTVLDILGKNSREELEKALFVLRGTPTGDAIEDILRDREHVSKAPSEKEASPEAGDETDDIGQLSDEVFVTRLGDEVFTSGNNTKDIFRTDSDGNLNRTDSDINSNNPLKTKYRQTLNNDKTSPEIHARDVTSSSEDTTNSDERENVKTNRWKEFDNAETINDVFERDDSFLLSSMLANPSEIDVTTTSRRWRDIFKAPELWKQGANENKVKIKATPISVVTLTGKHRQTMLK